MAAAAAIPPAIINVHDFMSYSVQSIIKRELYYLTIDSKGLAQFSTDYIEFTKTFPVLRQQKLRVNIASANFLKKNAQNSSTVERIVTGFLFSTDFFLNRMDEAKTIKYIGFHETNKAPCFNPFSNLYYPQTA